MNVHKVTLVVIDFDDIGVEDVKYHLEETKYPNHCMYPFIVDTETVDIGEWDDSHPLNRRDTFDAEVKRIFSK